MGEALIVNNNNDDTDRFLYFWGGGGNGAGKIWLPSIITSTARGKSK